MSATSGKVIGFGTLVLFGAISYFYRSGTNAMGRVISSDLALSTREYTAIINYYTYAFAAGSIVFGVLLCFVTPRWILSIVIAGGSIATVLTGFVSNSFGLGISRVALGLFLGGLLPVTIQIVRDWFPQKLRGITTGAGQSSIQLGALAAPLLGFAATQGPWRNVFFFMAIIGLATLPLWIWVAGLGYRKLPAASAGPIVRAENWSYVAARFLVDPVYMWFLTWIPVYFVITQKLTAARIGDVIATVYGAAAVGALAGGIASDLLIWAGMTASKARTIILAAATPFMMLAGVPLLTDSFNVVVISLSASYAAHLIWSVNLYAAVADSAPRRSVGLLTGIGAGTASIAGIATIPIVGSILQQSTFGPVFAAGLVLPLIGSAVALFVTLRIPRMSSVVCPQCGMTLREATDVCECGYSLQRQETAATSVKSETSVWSFQGRIGRASFLARMGLVLAGDIFATVLIAGLGNLAGEEGSTSLAAVIVLIYVISTIIAAWFAVATQVKRWHDLDKSGWMVLLNFTIIALPIVLIFHACVRGTRGQNRYGIDPLQ